MKVFFARSLPVVCIFLIWIVFASPFLFRNKVPFASTYQTNFFSPWSAYHLYDGPTKNAAMPDVIGQLYPWRHFTIENLKQGVIPLWNPYSFSGTPHLANYQSAVLSPLNILFFIFTFITAWSLLVLLQPLFAGLFMYLYMKSLRISNTGGLISAIGFMFCGFITTWMGYGTLAYAIVYLPLTLFAIERYYESIKLRYLFIIAITMPLSFFSGHFQISLYFLLAVIIYAIYKFFSTKTIVTTAFVLLYILFGLLLSMPQLLPSIEAYSQSIRSTLFQKSETIPWEYLLTFIAPDFFGNPVTRNDWFGHYAEWNGYIGLLPLMFAIYAIIRKRSKETIFFFCLSVFFLFLALPTPLLDMLVALHAPVLATSAASRIVVLYSFFMLVLTGFGTDFFIEDIKRRKMTVIFLLLIVFLLLFTGLWVIVVYRVLLPVTKIGIAKQNLIFPAILIISICFIFGILSIGNLFAKQNGKKWKIFLQCIFCILIFLVTLDMLRFATKWQAFDPKNLVFASVPLNTFLSNTNSQDRIFGNFGGEESVYYHHASIEGYDALYIRRYGEFISFLNNGILSESSRSVVSLPKEGKFTPVAINLLGVDYIVHKTSDGRKIWAFPFWTYPLDQFQPVYQDKAYQVYKNTEAYPRAFLAGDYIIQKDKQKILTTLFNPSTDTHETLILEENPHIRRQSESSGIVSIMQYMPNQVTLAVNSASQALLFLSDNYYPGWQATVDGKQTHIYRTDYTFRSVVVPQGKHIVVFSYKPFSFTLGLYLAVVGIIGAIGVLFLLKKRPRI